MTAKLLKAHSAKDRQQAGAILKQGGLVAVPTETVYGLAADARNDIALASIFEAKGRPVDHPLILHIANSTELEKWARDVPHIAQSLVEAFWPGALTLVLKKAEGVSDILTGGLDTVAIRMPNQPALLDILRTHELIVAAPSANPYEKLSPTQAHHVMNGMGELIDAVVDGGACEQGIESTILDISDYPRTSPRVLRPGPISASQIEAVLDQTVLQPDNHNEKVSGNKKVHYRPKATLVLCETEQLDALIRNGVAGVFLYHSEIIETALNDSQLHGDQIALRLPADHQGYAQSWYSTLHEVDCLMPDTVYTECVPNNTEWSGIANRIARAAIELNAYDQNKSASDSDTEECLS
ncbi:threonylcarbamoyl-AMP synthase [Bermanella marisrubri]|uniref:Threonylcarbamoyl-AMP synthase n=1 Tax=Bermanella marisrubri TaxID=207949 RepID=Q1N3C5_9GAMM|nr:L-threonylcarbamoyladenylate synthase [Bermanella marisrubri]EAT12666.1 hypothetical protein RED65_13317 [Oceanobacter sp. RED65] [Bermanella marisrubri]QIZ85210.1 threonylcarbamoyl-AMP synthase [Bermanella marisrubri]